jgi:Fe-S-cluster containining protein
MMELPVITNCDNCDNCGVCCHGQAGLPITYYTVLEPDYPLPIALRQEIEDTLANWTANGDWQGPQDGDPCVWYDQQTKRCIHHEFRPDICRDFEVGGEDCLRIRQETGIQTA